MADIIPRFFRTDEDSSVWRRTLTRMDWSLVGAVIVLSLVGLLSIYSATSPWGLGQAYLTRQASALALGFMVMTVLLLFPYQIFRNYYVWVYWASVAILIVVLIFGVRMRGSKSWFNFQIFYFQPVEMTRLALALALAAYADAHFREMRDWQACVPPLLMLALHLGLILLQPDFSSTLSMSPMTLAVLFAAGTSIAFLAGVVATGGIALGIPLVSTYFRLTGNKYTDQPVMQWLSQSFLGGAAFYQLWGGICLAMIVGWWFLRKWRVFIPGFYLACSLAVVVAGVGGSFVVKKGLKDYQRKRLIAFVDPKLDPVGSGYNILQSEIAIGSGRFFGKGYLSGSQSQLGFLPEQHTDFIFSLVAEEQGFFWTVFVLALYFWVVWRAFDIASVARDRFGRFVAVAIGAMFAFAGLFNIGMTMGLMPVTGVPFPFMSYGGSSAVGAYAAVGILLSIHLRRFIL